MRTLHILTALLLTSPPAFAQSATEGPLAAPETAPAAAAKPTTAAAEKSKTAAAEKSKTAAHKPAHRKPAKSAHREAPANGGSFETGRDGASPQPIAHAPGSGTPGDPLSFGMKWNGNSDDPRETRIQNYGGDAAGAGAEVGMKLHF